MRAWTSVACTLAHIVHAAADAIDKVGHVQQREAIGGARLEEARHREAERRVGHQRLAADLVGQRAEAAAEEEGEDLIEGLDVAADHRRLGADGIGAVRVDDCRDDAC